MARPKAPVKGAGSVRGTVAPSPATVPPSSLANSTAVFRPGRKTNPKTDRNSIAKSWQIEAYRHVNICGEARYAATQYAAMGGRAEIGISQPQALARKAVWVEAKDAAEEIAALAELAPTVRERARLIRTYFLHRVIAGECYLIARDKVDTDPSYEDDPNSPIWEIVAVTEIQKVGETWRVRHENGNYIDLKSSDPVIRMWCADPHDRMEAWSPFRSMLPTLREIEWLTMHIFTQVRSRMMSAGVWFLPNNLTFSPPPPDAVEGGAETIALMNEAEQFMASLAASAMQLLDDDEVSFPSVVMSDPAALEAVDKSKLIQFWSEIDDKAMTLRSSAVRRFALGMDMVPEKVLGSSGIAVDGAGGSAGSVNHWGVWANEEQTISNSIEPGLDDFVDILTTAFLRLAVEGTPYVVGYDTASLRLRQDRSKEAMEWYDRGELAADVALRETGFDPETDRMGEPEFRRWLLKRIAGGSATPEQLQSALTALSVILPPITPLVSGNEKPAKALPGRNDTPSLEDHPYEGPPRVQHDQSPAPYSVSGVEWTPFHAASEGLALRALEKYGNRLLNSGKRGRDKDRTTPPHLAHLAIRPQLPVNAEDFDLSLATVLLVSSSPMRQTLWERAVGRFCARLVNEGEAYTREGLIEAVRGL